jgi:flagellar protein FlaJ
MYQELIRFFGRAGTRFFGRYLVSLKELLEKSNLPILYEIYIGQLFFFSFLSMNFFLVYILYIFLIFWGFEFAVALTGAFIVSVAVTSIIATAFYLYPFSKYQSEKEDLERNMPLGLSYLNIISKSGVPLQKAMYFVSLEKPFGEFSKEFERIHKYMSVMGKDLTAAMKETSSRTPSDRFKNFIDGLSAIMISGGDTRRYLEEETRKELEDYRARGAKYTSAMSMFADIFIVVFLIAPLCILIVLSVFSMVEPTFLGVDIAFISKAIIYIIMPALGLAYLAVLSAIKV